MSQNVPAGWYPDNADSTLLRYWDGAQWTEHTHPAGGQQQTGPGPDGYGQAGQAHADRAAHDQAGQAYTPTPQGQHVQASPDQQNNSRNITGIVIGLVVVVALVIAGLIFLGIRVFSGDQGTTPAGTPQPAATEPAETEPGEQDGAGEPAEDPAGEGQEDPEADPGVADVDGGSFTAGDILEGAFGEGEQWVATMTVEEAGVTIIDAIDSGGSADLNLTVLDSSDTTIAANDDRGGPLTSLIGGQGVNPYLAPWLEAGEYTVVVGSYADQHASDFELYTVQAEEIGVGDEQAVELDEFQYVGRALIVTESGEHTIRASAQEWEAAIALFDSDGSLHTLEDPHAEDAALTAHLQEGGYLFVIADPGGDPDTFTFVVEGP